jgi:hypothetical protein
VTKAICSPRQREVADLRENDAVVLDAIFFLEWERADEPCKSAIHSADRKKFADYIVGINFDLGDTSNAEIPDHRAGCGGAR